MSSRLTRYRSKDRAGWPPPPESTDEAQLGCPQLRPQLFRVVLLEGIDDEVLAYVGSDPRTMDWMNVDDEDYRAQAARWYCYARGLRPFLRAMHGVATYIPSKTTLVLGNDDDEEAWHLPCLD